jgi:MoaA/NifB/PqqE/SkfB family radical SAM enzyme
MEEHRYEAFARDRAGVELNQLVICATLNCDKACAMCCVDAKEQHELGDMPFDSFIGLIDALVALGITSLPIVGFTGGEPFMYHNSGRTLSDLVRKVSELHPGRIAIQTSGYGPGVNDFREQVAACVRASSGVPIELATSFTLYQRPGITDRMKRTIQALVDECKQHTLYVYLTSNSRTFNETLRSFARLCNELGFANVELDNDLAQVRVETTRCRIIGIVGGTSP